MLAASRDGRRFVYNRTDGVYLRSLDQLDARLLPGTEESIWSQSFSPDGLSIAYGQRAQLKRLSLSGGAPIAVCSVSFGEGIHWAPMRV